MNFRELENNHPEKCPKCGTKLRYRMKLYDGEKRPSGWICPFDPKDCRIKELERELTKHHKASVKHVAELQSERDAALKARDEALEKLRAAEEEKRSLSANAAVDQTEIERLQNALDDMRDERDATRDFVLALRHALEDACLSIAVHGEQPPQLYLDALERTSALAAQRKREIQREAVEAAWERVNNAWEMEYMYKDPVRAAILGTTEAADAH